MKKCVAHGEANQVHVHVHVHVLTLVHVDLQQFSGQQKFEVHNDCSSSPFTLAKLKRLEIVYSK